MTPEGWEAGADTRMSYSRLMRMLDQLARAWPCGVNVEYDYTSRGRRVTVQNAPVGEIPEPDREWVTRGSLRDAVETAHQQYVGGGRR